SRAIRARAGAPGPLRSAARPRRRAPAMTGRASDADAARPGCRRRFRPRPTPAESRAPRRVSTDPAASVGSSLEHEADAAHRADQLRLTESAAQVGDVPVDGV